MIGGIYAAALAGLGMYLFATESWPLAFGIDLWGDRPHSFPSGTILTPLLGTATVTAASGFAFVLNRAAKRELWARQLGVACFIVAATAAGAVAYELSAERRCARIEYSNEDRCMTPLTSASRDFVILGMPAVAAAVLLAREPMG